MSRYLTPSKIALLCLISIYTEGVVPNSSAIHVLSFLVANLSPLESGSVSFSGKGNQGCAVSVADLEDALSSKASSIPGRSVWDLFLKKIWSIDSCDALEVFFADICDILAKSREEQIRDRDNGLAPEIGCMRLSRCSPLGAFVRRAQLEFTRLQFHDSVKLWKGFVHYRLPTYRVWSKKNPSAERDPVDINLLELKLDTYSQLAQVAYGNIEADAEDETFVSTKDVERLLEFQIGELQRLGGRVPDGMKVQLERIISSGVTLPNLVYYLRFLDAWRAGDYPSSFDNLHRYFDYTMHSRDRSSYQYALLNLAILQADFGCYGEAVSAMQEAVSIARESHDMNCLNFCMSWLYHFGKAFPEQMKDVQNTGMLGNEKEGLAFLEAKAKETEMWSLLSTTLLSEAKLELQNGESLASTIENIVRASHLNVTKNLVSSMGPQLLLQNALYSRIGVTHLAWLSNEIFRQCYANRSPFEDYLKSTFRSCELLAQQGRYRDISALMKQVAPEKLRSLKENQHWTFFSGILQLKRQICRDDKVAADHLLSQLEAIQLPGNDASLLLSFLSIKYKIRQGDYGRALEIVEQTAQSIHQDNFDIYSQVRLLCFKARIFQKTGNPQRGFSLAMRAASIAHRSRLLPGLWEAICVLGGVLLSLREFEAVHEMIESIMPQVLETDDCDLTAQAYSLLVDANMGMAGKLWSQGQNTPAKTEYMNRALGYLDCAYDQYEEIEDIKGQCEMMAKKATVMHLTGDLVLANDYAAKYLDLQKLSGVSI
ncbi:putative anaphase-promoting complex subunit Apc5 [Aspergillus clavatus NRRL 1]|uniref:Anaphase-promoting complex subunit 5 n=1 Tax=Aspergillus clavatus (strain ATCC 1007 / CBS 513.65 / DSM 816 / NCTC 3887 / NRRL 1 / QM 1276 / 107) TaxID=344612 RepID=A1CJ88_ASPCL|nr:anaphase-promoting complex protein [Aspergillus clavatus NRRL 1]EAW09212.1 anaphase-promoting complex protein [Aspergillus clavatus NRRL 1]